MASSHGVRLLSREASGRGRAAGAPGPGAAASSRAGPPPGPRQQQQQQRQGSKPPQQQQPAPAAKELQLRPRISEHDLATKLKRAEGWLEDGLRVQLVVEFKGGDEEGAKAAAALVESVAARLAGRGQPMGSKRQMKSSWLLTIKPLAPPKPAKQQPQPPPPAAPGAAAGAAAPGAAGAAAALQGEGAPAP